MVVPLKPQFDWDTVKDFSQAIVQHLARTLPQRFVAKSGGSNRVGKIFIDYLRNGFGATTVCAWSARARPGLGISVPVRWDELDGLKRRRALDGGLGARPGWTRATRPGPDYEASRNRAGPGDEGAGLPADAERQVANMQEQWPRTLWIVRHGQSAGNVARDAAEAAGLPVIDIAERDIDTPLSELGRRQAARWATGSANCRPSAGPRWCCARPMCGPARPPA